jgi:hypothetical protein
MSPSGYEVKCLKLVKAERVDVKYKLLEKLEMGTHIPGVYDAQELDANDMPVALCVSKDGAPEEKIACDDMYFQMEDSINLNVYWEPDYNDDYGNAAAIIHHFELACVPGYFIDPRTEGYKTLVEDAKDICEAVANKKREPDFYMEDGKVYKA